MRWLFDTLGAWFVQAPAPSPSPDPIDAVLAVVPARFRDAARLHVPVVLAASRGLRVPAQIAYVLATVEHECGFGHPRFSRSVPLVEDHNPFRRVGSGWEATVHTSGARVEAPTKKALELRYWDVAYGGRLGNRRGTRDGADFRGRGYVQLTGRDNYRRLTEHLVRAGFGYDLDGQRWGDGRRPLDLVCHPTHVHRVPALAARVLVDGMMEGLFTGRALPEFVSDGRTDFEGARRVVNGTDRAAAIAVMARRYLAVLG